MDTWLTVDLGNTRCKLQLWHQGAGAAPHAAQGAEFSSRAEAGEALTERVLEWLRIEGKPTHAALTSVASPALTDRLDGALGELVEHFIEAPSCGLTIRCTVPGEVGLDRLYGARGALERLQKSCIVVDAGTAVTVDALRYRAPWPAEFLGGAIAPGPMLLAESLGRAGARLPGVTPIPGAPALGRDTEAAIRSGSGVGFRGAVRELVDEVSWEAELADAPVVLTGGARAFLLEPRPFIERGLTVVPELVHLGLLAAAQDAIAGVT